MRIDERELFKSVMVGFMTDEDPMLAMLKWITEQLMQIEAEMKVGANKNEHNSQRKTHFSGYRPRRFDTRMGTMYLMVPKLRQGGYVPFFVTAMMIAYGVGMDGKREVLAIEPFFSESNESWRAFFKKLKHRGLEKCALVISDAHQGIQNAVKTEMTGSSWQRCKVHFMRNILAYVRPKSKALFSDRLKQIWLQKTLEDAQKQSKLFIQEYEARYPEAIQCLEEGLEDSLQFFHFDFIDHRRISSTNVLERLNREVRRRSRVVGIFPSRDSYLRLLTSYLMEYTEEWEVERSYIQPQKLELVMIKREALLQNAA